MYGHARQSPIVNAQTLSLEGSILKPAYKSCCEFSCVLSPRMVRKTSGRKLHTTSIDFGNNALNNASLPAWQTEQNCEYTWKAGLNTDVYLPHQNPCLRTPRSLKKGYVQYSEYELMVRSCMQGLQNAVCMCSYKGMVTQDYLTWCASCRLVTRFP